MTDFITDFILSLLPIKVISFWTCQFVVKSLRYLALYYDSLAANLFKQSCCRLRASFSPDWTSIHFFAVICAYWSENWRLTLSVVLYFISLFSVIVGRNSWDRRTVQKMAFCSLHTVSFFACLYSLETWAIFLKECLFTFWRKSGNYLVQFTYLMFILEVVCFIN